MSVSTQAVSSLSPNQAAMADALARQATLTKPAGALGRLESLAVWFAGRTGQAIVPRLAPAICIFAADHGVAAENVSAYPQAVTFAMLANFASGGAAINVLARQCDASLTVVDVGVVGGTAPHGVMDCKVAQGTANLLHEAAMTSAQVHTALDLGAQMAAIQIGAGATLLIAGEMGIGNTTAAACLVSALTGEAPANVVGRGTGLDDTQLAHKIAVVAAALARVAKRINAPTALDFLTEVGGLEIAAMAGFLHAASAAGVPVLLDGFIVTAAALVAEALWPDSKLYWLASHVSPETGHRLTLDALGLTPLLDFELRLGEGSGAALVVPLLQSALALHREMATFTQAGIPRAV